MKKLLLFGLLALASLLSGCNRISCDTGIGTCDEKKWSDPNYDIMSVGAYNYTEHDIYGVYILPPDKNDIAFAGKTSGALGTQKNALKWSGQGGNSPNLAWDLRWKTPRKFKIWWLRVVDQKLFDISGKKYDIYTQRETEPGYAWCEYEVEIKETYGELHGVDPYPNMKRNELTLYFYPNGTVKAHLEFGFDAEVPSKERVDVAKRDQLPVLKDRACIKEVRNPLYGKPKPIDMY